MNFRHTLFNLSLFILTLADSFFSYLRHFICHPAEILIHQWCFWNSGVLQYSVVNNDTFLFCGFNTFIVTTSNLICQACSMTWNPSAFSFVQKLILPVGLIRSMLQFLMSCVRSVHESILQTWMASWKSEGDSLDLFFIFYFFALPLTN